MNELVSTRAARVELRARLIGLFDLAAEAIWSHPLAGIACTVLMEPISSEA